MITTRRPLDSVARFTGLLPLLLAPAWTADANPFARSNPRTNLFDLNLISPSYSGRSPIRDSPKKGKTSGMLHVTAESLLYGALGNPNPVPSSPADLMANSSLGISLIT
jgi:hypothetical protein